VSATEILRAYRVALDHPTPTQVELLQSHAGASRWAFNFALDAKIASRQVWQERVGELVATGTPEAEARKLVRVKTPNRQLIDKARVRVRGTNRSGKPEPADWAAAEKILRDGGMDEEVAVRILQVWWEQCLKRGLDPVMGVQTWAPRVTNSVIQHGELDADVAWDNWMKSVTGKRAGRRVGFPRFKAKGKARDSFYIPNTEFAISTPRRLRLGGKIGELRTAEPLRRLRRAIERRQGKVQSVTVSRGGSRWYASVLLKEVVDLPDHPSRRQQASGTVGVDVGVKVAAALSTGELIPNPRMGRAAAPRLRRAQRAFARTRKGSKRQRKAAARIGRIQYQLAERRATFVHGLSKKLATGFAVVAIEDLNLVGMTRSAKGTKDSPGKKVWQKAGLNREMLDLAHGELRRQLAYKTGWYGARLAFCGRFEPSSQVCSACDARARIKLTLNDRVFHCEACGLVIDRDINAATNIARWAYVAPDMEETLNACGEDVRPKSSRAGGRTSVKREGRPLRRSPRSSDAAATP
jgi:putative transposase